MTTDFILHVVIVAAALSGFFIARHIRHKKKTGPFVCPLKFDCHTVVTSDYSRLFGIPIEFIGMVYYFLVAVSYVTFIGFPEYKTLWFQNGVLIVTVIAFLFSMYLTAIQAFKLKQWCSLCLFSAGFCTVIFIAALLLVVA